MGVWCFLWLAITGPTVAQTSRRPAGPVPPGQLPASAPAPAKLPATSTTPAPSPAVTETPPAKSLAPGEVGPELFLLRDKDGRLQAVPGFSFEDFVELYRMKHQLGGGDERPRYVLAHSMLTGSVNGPVVAITAELTIDLNDDNWVRIPLGFSNAVVDGEAKLTEGTGEVLLQYTEPRAPDRSIDEGRVANAGGYVLWLRGEARKTHKVTLPLMASISTVGGETQLRLEAPRATVAQLVLDVPVEHALGRVSDGATLLEPQSAVGKTTFSVVGATGHVELAWRSPGNPLAATPSVLEASGMVWTRIDGRSAGSEAKLVVRSFGGPFDSFRVRLPPGAQLIGNSQQGITLSPLPTEGDNQTAGTIVEVKLEKKTTGPVEVRLVADRPRTADNPDELIELAGFEVIGAVRQWGDIGVQVVGNWQVVWGESRGVRQVDDVPESFRRDDLVAAFEYTAQPCSLLARVVPRKTRVSVQPQYLLRVGARETRLAAELKYTVRGAKVRALTVELPGWEIDDIGPPSLVNVDAAAIDESAKFSIPLAQPSNGDLTLTITARRLSPGGKPETLQMLEFDLPRPQAEVIAPAVVVVQPDDNVELVPRGDASVGLSLRSSRPAVSLPVLQQDPLFYQSEGTTPKFVADFTIHTQSIAASVDSRLDLDEQEIHVDERLRYDIAYEPVDKLTLNVPRTIALDKLEVSLDGARLIPTVVREENEAEAHESQRVAVSLGGSRIGHCELVVVFHQPQDKLPAATSVPISVPLVMPAEGQLKHNRLFATAKSGIALNSRKGSWSIDDRARAAAARLEGLWLMSDEAAESVGLAVTLQDRLKDASTLVDDGWIQTWLTASGRQDRVVLRLTTSDRRLRIDLPENVATSAVEALLDGHQVPFEIDSKGGVVLNLPASSVNQQHLLELAYHVASRDPVGHLSIEPPRFRPEVWSRRLYWQLIVPSNEHLMLAPQGFTGEFSWEWSGKFWRRVPTLNEQELETWLGTSHHSIGIPATANCYLFSTVGECPTIRLWTVRRATLVFTTSLAILVAGLALLYVPLLRHPAVLFVAAVALVAFGFSAPDLALLAGQSAALGVVLLGVAVLLARVFKPATVLPVPQSVVVEPPLEDQTSTDFYYRTASAGAHSSTATAPLVLPGAGAETSP